MSFENSAYADHYRNMMMKFNNEVNDYLVFMEKRYKIVTLDYIATLEHDNKMKQSWIEHLEKILAVSQSGTIL